MARTRGERERLLRGAGIVADCCEQGRRRREREETTGDGDGDGDGALLLTQRLSSAVCTWTRG